MQMDAILNNELNKNNIYFSIYLYLFNFQVKALPSLKKGKQDIFLKTPEDPQCSH